VAVALKNVRPYYSAIPIRSITPPHLFALIEGWGSLFHPNSLLNAERAQLMHQMISLHTLLEQRRDIRVADNRTTRAESEHRLDVAVVLSDSSESSASDSASLVPYTVSVWEADKRLSALLCPEMKAAIRTEPGGVSSAAFEDLGDMTERVLIACSDAARALLLPNSSQADGRQSEELTTRATVRVRDGLLDQGLFQTMRALCEHSQARVSIDGGVVSLFPACLQLIKVRDTHYIMQNSFILSSESSRFSFQDLSELASSVSSSLVHKEQLVRSGAAHSTDRRQYLTLLLCTAPGMCTNSPTDNAIEMRMLTSLCDTYRLLQFRLPFVP
jgi:hypothetical protein